jgi:PAS domain S-box-containing protein
MLQTAVAAARIGVWELDVPTGKVVGNQCLREIYGLESHESLTLEFFVSRIHPADQSPVTAQVEACLSGAVEMYDIEHRLVWPDASVHWVHVRGNVLHDEQGRGTRLIGTMVDVTERKEAEQKLLAHDQLLRQLIAHTPAAVAMFDRDMRYLANSQRWVSDYNLEGVSLIGRSHYEVFPDQPERWREIHRRALGGAVERCDEDPFPRGDGSTDWLQWEVQPWREASGEIAGIIMFTQVITARKRAEEALQRAEEKFARVFWAAPVAICMTRVADGLIFDVNREFERLFGFLRAEAVGRTTVDLGLWPDPDERRRLVRQGMNPGDVPTVTEVALRAKDGALIPVSSSAHRLQYEGEQYVLSAFQDLSERRRSDAAIRASESRLRRVFSSPIVGMAFVSGDGKVSEANDECLRILGYTAAEAARTRLDLRKHVPTESQTLLAQALSAGNTLANKPRELELLRRDGARVPVLLGISTIDEESGGRIAFLFDLSERRGLERQLLHAQRMEAVGRLAAGIAHDFNNVLSAINMGTELLRDTLPADHAGREDLREVRKATDRAIRLVRQLLAFSRQQVLEPRVLGLNDLVTNLENMLRRLLGDHILMIIELHPGLQPVKADPGQIEQMILNLVVNARDAMPEGGNLTLVTDNVQLETECTFDVPVARGPYVVLSVSDTGIGMDAATRARMFEPFFTTKEQGKGTGLGLSTVYGIVRQSGGAIDVVSAPNCGTTIRIYLPRVEEPLTTSMIPSASDLVGGHETILVVEDDAAVRRTTRKLLVSLGYRVLETEGPGAALALAKVYVGGIDALLVDIKLPGKNGRDLAAEMLALRPKLRALFMSGHADGALLEAGGLAAGQAFIQKPFSSTALARKLRALLDTEAR